MKNIYRKALWRLVSTAVCLLAAAALHPASGQSTGTTGNANWIQANTFTGTGSTDYYMDITYYNGLGMEEMSISGAASGNGNSIVVPVAYDQCLRPDARVMLPFESTGSNLAKVTGQAADARYSALYGSADAEYAFTENTFDSYSLNRPVSSVKPGVVGRDRSASATMSYGISTVEDKVLNIRFNEADASISVASGPVYLCGLAKTTATDETGRTTIVFTDVAGRTVLVRQLDSEATDCGLDTYTVYDMTGREAWVISPEGSAMLGPATVQSCDGNLAKKWCYIYKYDSLGRLIWKRLPGKSEELIVYDQGDRPVLYQDGHLRSDSGKWIYTVYDQQGREIEKTVVKQAPTVTETQIRMAVGALNLQYPTLENFNDYRIPCSMFTFVRHLSSTRYGGETYRTSTSGTTTGTFAIPSDLAYDDVANVVGDSDLSPLNGQLKVYEKVWLLGDTESIGTENDYVERSFHYDAMGRLIQTVERDPWDKISRTSQKYDFSGNVLVQKEEHVLAPGGQPIDHHQQGGGPGGLVMPMAVTKTVTSTYDQRGKILSETTDTGGPLVLRATSTVAFGYDALGRLDSVTTGDGVTREMTRTTQGWTSGIDALTSSRDTVFTQSLYYMENGNISKVRSRQGSSPALSFGVQYDNAGRMIEWKQPGTNALAEKGITYDRNGNILSVKRYDVDGQVSDDLTFVHNGNRLTRVDESQSRYSLSYDSDGRLTADPRRGINGVTYNEIGQVQSVSGLEGGVEYLYLADGSKLAAISGNSGLAYCGSIVCSISKVYGKGKLEFESTGFSAGRIVENSGQAVPNYMINDYLSSVRVVTDQTGNVLERNDYYGFGGRMDCGSEGDNRYRFSSKETQTVGAIGWLDFGARMYDPYLCRWTSPDPLAEKYRSLSPYGYCAGDPVNYIDPTGMEFTEEAQKYVEELKQAIRARRMNNAREIKKLKRQISSGDLTDDKVEYCKCQINSLKDDTAEMKKIQGELALLGASDQIYDIFETDVYNTDTHATSAVLYNLFTGVFEIQLGENNLFQLAHELLHAYQFEIGAFSCSFEQNGLPFYDQDDEKAAYKRGQLFGGPSFTDYEKNYSQFQAGPCSVRGSYPRKAFHHPSAFQRLANNTCSAFRVNGTTFVVETQILEKLILK